MGWLKREESRKYQMNQFIFWHSKPYRAGGVVVEFRKDMMRVDIRESNSPTLVAGTAYWFMINDREWSDTCG